MRIDWVPLADGGRIGMTHCPGAGGDPTNDLDELARQASVLVTLMTKNDLLLVGLHDLSNKCSQRSLPWLHLPIDNMKTPTGQFEQLWQRHALTLHQQLRHGNSVVLHCAAGLGRTGMVACRLLFESGIDANQALTMIRQARPGTVETEAQQAWVLALGNSCT